MWPAKGDEAAAEEWRLLKLAPLRADAALDTIEHMLSVFEDAIEIARASVMGDFVPFGWVSVSFVVVLFATFSHSALSGLVCSSSTFSHNRRLGRRCCKRHSCWRSSFARELPASKKKNTSSLTSTPKSAIFKARHHPCVWSTMGIMAIWIAVTP
jgi:hypothetical protein